MGSMVLITYLYPYPVYFLTVRFAVINDLDYAFAENGLSAYKLGQLLPSESFINFVGEEKYKVLVNFILHYLADMDIPIKR